MLYKEQGHSQCDITLTYTYSCHSHFSSNVLSVILLNLDDDYDDYDDDDDNDDDD